MAIISDTTKIDKSFKFVSGKGYTTTQKGVDNEDAASGFIIGTSSIFSQDAAIPTVAPGASTSILTFYGDGTPNPARFRMIYDVSSPLNKAWYASTDGSTLTNMRTTRIPNWVPPTFGNYTIRIFLTVGSSTTTAYLQEIFFSDATSPIFDYKTGILTFESDPLAAYASLPGGPPDGVQISGYVYTGPLLSQIFDGNGDFTGGLSDFGTSTALAKFVNPNKSFEVSSPFAIGTTWVTESTPYGTTNVNWNGASQFSNGKIIVVGIANSFSAIVYSYGDGAWKTPTTMPSLSSGVGFSAVWASSNTLFAYIVDDVISGIGLGGLFRSTDGGNHWSSLSNLSFQGIAIWGSSNTTVIGGTTTPSDIFIVGVGGNIVHATDGATFSAQTNADSHDLNSVWGSSSSDIYAVGASGTIRHSVGAGTWLGQTSGTANNLFSVFGFSSTEIYAAGASGTILKSTGGGSWVSFNTGVPSTLTVNSIWGISSGGTKKLYVSGPDSGTSHFTVYVSSGTNSWTLETTFLGPITQNFSVFGGLSGVFGGLSSASAPSAGRIAAVHTNPVEIVHGNTKIDGYLNVGTSITAANITLNGSYGTIDVDSILNKLTQWSPSGFLLRDEFVGTALDASLWQLNGTTGVTDDNANGAFGCATMTGASTANWIMSNSSLPLGTADVWFMTRIKFTTLQTGVMRFGLLSGGTTIEFQGSSSPTNWQCIYGGTTVDSGVAISGYQILEFRRISGIVYFFINGVLLFNAAFATSLNCVAGARCNSNSSPASAINIDYIRCTIPSA